MTQRPGSIWSRIRGVVLATGRWACTYLPLFLIAVVSSQANAQLPKPKVPTTQQPLTRSEATTQALPASFSSRNLGGGWAQGFDQEPNAAAEGRTAAVISESAQGVDGTLWSVGTADVSAFHARILDGRQVACLAAEKWQPAAALRARAKTIQQLYCQEEDDCVRLAVRSMVCFLNCQAKSQEDIAAANGLRAYYARVAIAEQLEMIERSQMFLEQQRSRQRRAVAEGLSSDFDVTGFDRQAIEIEDSIAQLIIKDRQLRSLLEQLTGMSYELQDTQQEPLEVYAQPLNCEALQRIALAQRGDYLGWSCLASGISEESARIYAELLASAVVGWGIPLPALSGLKQLLCSPDYTCLAANMRRELSLTLSMQASLVQQSVQEKCLDLELCYQRIAFAERTIASWQERIEQLQRVGELGDTRPEEMAAAHGALLGAQVEEIKRRLQARQAEVDLAEAIGGLADRCCAGRGWLLTGVE